MSYSWRINKNGKKMAQRSHCSREEKKEMKQLYTSFSIYPTLERSHTYCTHLTCKAAKW